MKRRNFLSIAPLAFGLPKFSQFTTNKKDKDSSPIETGEFSDNVKWVISSIDTEQKTVDNIPETKTKGSNLDSDVSIVSVDTINSSQSPSHLKNGYVFDFAISFAVPSTIESASFTFNTMRGESQKPSIVFDYSTKEQVTKSEKRKVRKAKYTVHTVVISVEMEKKFKEYQVLLSNKTARKASVNKKANKKKANKKKNEKSVKKKPTVFETKIQNKN